MIRTLLAGLGLVTLLGIAVSGLHAAGWWPGERRPAALSISHAGLDLAAPEGRRLLDRRLEAAIDRICGGADLKDLRARLAERNCRRKARASAEPQIAQAVARAQTRAQLADAAAKLAPVTASGPGATGEAGAGAAGSPPPIRP